MEYAPYYVCAYLAGSIPFGWIIARAKGVNIREVGSGNIGATNVGRALGKPFAVLVFILDFAKGFVPVWLTPPGHSTHWPLAVVALLTVIGHNYPIWLGFKGGKGVATSAGALSVLLPVTVLVAAAVWALIYFSTRYVSLASLGCAVSLPVTTYFYRPLAEYLILTSILMVLGFIRHWSNILALFQGKEHRFSRTPSP
jgi:glycerol-3-phosphate acyltransferase PlsY